MDKKQKGSFRYFFWIWFVAISDCLVEHAVYPPSRYYLMGGIALSLAVLLGIWCIWRQYKKAQRMDRTCWAMVVLSVLFAILGIVILLI